MTGQLLIYGANGYTGELIARLAVERGIRPILAGRNRDSIAALSSELGAEQRVFALDDPAMVAQSLDGVAAVLHCAGPFVHTAKPMAEGCIRAGAHYLDITGEVGVFESLAARGSQAQARGVMLLPGVGFDVVPSDCLAAHLKRRLPEAHQLTLAIRALSQLSRGTATTMVEHIHHGGVVRRNGKLTPVPTAHDTRNIDFGRGPVETVATPWGDVSTAFYSTGIPNITVYMAFPATMRRLMRASRHVSWLVNAAPVRGLLKQLIKRGAPGPDADQRERGLCLLWGEVIDPAGNRCVSRLRTPEGYTLTAESAVTIAEKVLAGQVSPGFQTPSLAYGADLVLELSGVVREDEQ